MQKQDFDNHYAPMRRSIWPITVTAFCLIVSLCLPVSMPASCCAAETKGQPGAGQLAWPIFRADRNLTGRVRDIPANPVALWRFRSLNPIESGVAVGYGRIFFGNSAGQFYALNQQSGEKEWEINIAGGVVAAPLLPLGQKQPLLFIGTQDGTFLAIDALSGKIAWRFKCEGKITSSATFFYDGQQMRIVFGAYDFKLHCLDAGTGQELWSIPTENFINGTPAVSGHLLVFGGCDSFLRVVQVPQATATQAINLGSYLPSSPALEGQTAWVANYDSTVFSVDIASGETNWEFRNENGGPFMAPLAISAQYVVAADEDGRIVILHKKTGLKHRNLSVTGKVTAGPLVDDRQVIIADEDGFLTVFDLETGEETWRLEHGAAVLAPLAVAGRRIYVADEEGTLTVYGKNNEAHNEK